MNNISRNLLMVILLCVMPYQMRIIWYDALAREMAIILIKWYHNAGALEDRYYHPDIRKHVDIFHCDYCQHVKIPHKRIGLLHKGDLTNILWWVVVDLIWSWSAKTEHFSSEFYVFLDTMANLVYTVTPNQLMQLLGICNTPAWYKLSMIVGARIQEIPSPTTCMFWETTMFPQPEKSQSNAKCKHMDQTMAITSMTVMFSQPPCILLMMDLPQQCNQWDLESKSRWPCIFQWHALKCHPHWEIANHYLW